MSAKFIGRRATALATTLAVVAGLAITPAFTATAAEGDPVEGAQPIALIEPAAPIAEPVEPETEAAVETRIVPLAPAAALEEPVSEPAPAPAGETRSDQGEAEARSPIAPVGTGKSGSAAEPAAGTNSMVAPMFHSSIQPNTVGPLVAGQSVYIRFSYPGADRWRISSVPYGLTFYRSTGELAGTVHYAGSYTFTVTAEDRYFFGWYRDLAEKTYTVTVGNAAPVVTTYNLDSATVDVAYSQQLTASGTGPISYRTSQGALPAGLSLSSTGLISGTPKFAPGYIGSNRIDVSVIANNGNDSVARQLSITVLTPGPQFGNAPLATANVGESYTQALPIITGYGTFTYVIDSGSLPTGLTLGSDGVITGTPEYDASYTASQSFPFTARMSGPTGSASQTFTLGLQLAGPTVATTTLPSGWWKQPYSQPITVTGPGAIVTVDGLPAGLAFDGENIAGSTRSNGGHELIITAVNGAGEHKTTVTLTINGKPVLLRMPVIKVETGETIRVAPPFNGVEVDLTLGTDAPAGMRLNRNDRIVWTPSAPGVYEFTVHATNPAGSDERRYTVKVFDLPVITQGDLRQGVINMPYRQKLHHDGTNVRFKVVRGNLPDGLELTRNGVIRGTATEAGVFSFKVRARNAVGVHSAWFNLTVLEPAMTLSSGTVIRGNSLTVSGSGYLPGDTLELWLHSTPVLLGTVIATDGSFTSTVTIPASTAAGQHDLVVTAAKSGTQSVPLTIGTPPAAPQQPQSKPAAQNPQLTVTPETETAEVEEAAVEAAGPEAEELAEEVEEDLPTLEVPDAEEDAAAEAPADFSGLLYAAFALLLAALLVSYILWHRRRATES